MNKDTEILEYKYSPWNEGHQVVRDKEGWFIIDKVRGNSLVGDDRYARIIKGETFMTYTTLTSMPTIHDLYIVDKKKGKRYFLLIEGDMYYTYPYDRKLHYYYKITYYKPFRYFKLTYRRKGINERSSVLIDIKTGKNLGDYKQEKDSDFFIYHEYGCYGLFVFVEYLKHGEEKRTYYLQQQNFRVPYFERGDAISALIGFDEITKNETIQL